MSLAHSQSQVDARLRVGDAVGYRAGSYVVDALYLKYDLASGTEEEFACLRGLYNPRRRVTVKTTALLKGA